MRVLIHGSYHSQNYGDLLLADLLADQLSKRYAVTVTCPQVHPTMRGGLHARAGRGWADSWPARAAVLGGGGYLHGADQVATRRLLRYLIPARIWQLTRVPYVLVGVGGGPRLVGKAASRVATICHGAKAIAVRDEVTRSLLCSSGVPDSRIEVTADIVMGMSGNDIPQEPRAVAEGLLDQERIRYRKLALHLPPGKFTSRFREVCVRVGEVLKSRDDIDVYCLQDHGDRSNQIKEMVAGVLPQARIVPWQDHWVTAALIGQMDCILSAKLHVGITAWALGVPVCGFSLHEKTSRFFAQIERSRFQVGVESDPNVVTDWVREFAEDPQGFAQENPNTREHWITKANRNYQIIEQHLGPHLPKRK